MEMIGFLGKKVDLKTKDGKHLAGYVFDVLGEDDSDIGCECVDIALLDTEAIVEIPTEDITEVEVDEKFRELDFRQ